MKDFKKGGFGGGNRSGGFNKGGFGGDRGGFGSKPSFGGKPAFKKSWDNKGGDRGFGGDKQMHSATCSNCGKPCEVPFRPSAGKEVFCNDCFSKMKGNETFVRNDSRGGYDDRAPRASAPAGNLDAVVRQMQVVTSKLDQLISMMASNAKQPSAPKAPQAEKPSAAPAKEVAEKAQPAPAPKAAKAETVAAPKKAAAKPAKAAAKPAAKKAAKKK